MRNLLIVGGSPEERSRLARRRVPDGHTLFVLDSSTLPFIRAGEIVLPAMPRAILVDEVDRAFPDCQAGGTRLVLTQSTYLLQRWIDRLDEHDVIVATADRAALERCAPEAFQRRGPWETFEIVEAEELSTTVDTVDAEEQPNQVLSSASPVSSAVESVRIVARLLARAYAMNHPAERLALCREAVALAPDSPVAWLALASACRETRDGAAARDALDRAAALAQNWEAPPYESGKLSLVYDDMNRARDAFQRAADLMPTFSAAFSNLGATLGELDDPNAALAAFHQAVTHDPHSFTILNNIGVVCRELGRLDESEAAFRRVIEINPAFVFGHYNLGHTLFLGGKYPAAVDAYEEGQRRDPQRNRRQGCRLALARFANGDAAGAERDLWASASTAPADEREDLLLEAYEVAHALLEGHPGLEPHRPFLDRLGAEIAKSE